MQHAEFDRVNIQVMCRPTGGVFSTTEYNSPEFTFEASAGSVRVFNAKEPGKFVQYGPGHWWASGRVTPPEQSKNKTR